MSRQVRMSENVVLQPLGPLMTCMEHMEPGCDSAVPTIDREDLSPGLVGLKTAAFPTQ